MRDAIRRWTTAGGLIAMVACSGASSSNSTAGAPRVAIVFDLGGRGDHGFNDGAAAGAERAAAGGKATLEFTEGGSGNQRVDVLRGLARGGADLVIAVGFLSSGDATIAAREFPKVHFAVIDYALPTDAAGKTMVPPPNLAGLSFREEEGSYVVGALAGLTTRTHAVGFVGGMPVPTILRFESGYAAGVHKVCPSCTVIVKYAGTTPAGFRDPAAGRALALAEYAAGADIVFHAAGETGSGVFAAAKESGHYAVGVDVDQSAAAPGRVLTSMLKRIDVAVEGVIAQQRAGTFHGGVSSLGLAEQGVGYVYDAGNAALIPAAVHMTIETLRAAVAAGLIVAPAVR